MHAFKYMYDNHINEADWFMKADDDTFAIMENLRYFLSDKNPSDAVYYGHHFNVIVKPQGYFSGGEIFEIDILSLKLEFLLLLDFYKSLNDSFRRRICKSSLVFNSRILTIMRQLTL